MNQITPQAKIEIIPSSAPFSEAQRSWLNGFFAGLLSDATPLPTEQGAAVMLNATGDGDDGDDSFDADDEVEALAPLPEAVLAALRANEQETV